MSTVPGHDAWADAGLVGRPTADAVDLDADAERDAGLVPRDDDSGELVPPSSRPDLDGVADEADVVEQSTPVPDDERDDYP